MRVKSESAASPVASDLECHQQATGSDLESLLIRLRTEARKRRTYSILYALVLLAWIAMYSISAMWETFGKHGYLIPPMIRLLVSAPLIYLLARKWRLDRHSAKTLMNFDDVRTVGPLAEVLALGEGHFGYDKETRAMARAALLRLLPRLKAEDAHLLNSDQRTALYQMLNTTVDGVWKEKQADFQVAILNALEHVGDEQALPYVRNWALFPARSANGIRVKRAAQHCLPLLQERVKKEQVAADLLRAAEAPQAASETLLRPGIRSIEPQPDQLLRPSMKKGIGDEQAS